MTIELHYNVYGCHRPPAADIDLAATAVEAGFEGIWIGDHFMPWIDSRPYTHHPFAWLGALMNEVPDVPVGTSVTCPTFRYRPPLVAQTLATLDNMYPGRLHLGVGVGEALNEAHFVEGEWPDWETRADRLVEALDVIERLWEREGYVEYDGAHFSYDGIRLFTLPKSDFEIHWAGWGPTSCEYAGRFADHLLTIAPAERIAEDILPRFERGLEAAGRSPSEADVTSEFVVNVGDPADLVAEIRERGEYVPADSELDTADPREIQAVANRELAAMSDEEVRRANRITDDPAEIAEWIEAYEDAGVTRLLVGSNCGDPRRTIETFEDRVVPRL